MTDDLAKILLDAKRRAGALYDELIEAFDNAGRCAECGAVDTNRALPTGCSECGWYNL